MDDLKNKHDDPDAIPGVITKTATISPLEATEDDLKKINKYTLSPLTADEVFVFKATIADNEQDDRNFMPFNEKAIRNMAKLYPGKTMLMDHNRKASNQIARIFDTEIIQTEKRTELGELHTELSAKMYMVKTRSNEDLIMEIKAGIKKEVSTGTVPEKMVCSICGTDNMQKYCRHYPGYEYTIEDGTAKGKKRRCKMLLDGVKEAYELSFVAIPAQPRAGTHKSVGFAKPCEAETETPTEEPNDIEKGSDDLALRLRSAESFIFIKNQEDNNHE